MSFLQYLTRVFRATFWLAVHLSIAIGLFLASAHLGAQPGEDERNGGLLVRVLASFWLYIAVWSWLVRGIFQRPASPAAKSKPTGAEAIRSTVGCVGNLLPIPVVFVLAGRAADWAWAGLRGGDAGHPARLAADRVMAGAAFALDHAGEWVVWAIAGVVLYNVSRLGRRWTSRRNPAARKAQHANDAALQELRPRGRRQKGAARAPVAPREVLAAAGAASAATIGRAHAGAHGADTARFTPGSAREDRVLGALTFSAADGAWWAHRPDGGFPLQIDGGAQGPDPRALDLARQAVQRSFEMLLRASEAARTEAQKRGVGLPRFTISAVRVGAGSSPDVLLHLRCDADAGHEYLVQSDDKLLTFTTASRT